MTKITLTDSKGNEIKDILHDVLTFDCETTGTRKDQKGKKGSFSSRPGTEIGTGCRAGKQGCKIVK